MSQFDPLLLLSCCCSTQTNSFEVPELIQRFATRSTEQRCLHFEIFRLQRHEDASLLVNSLNSHCCVFSLFISHDPNSDSLVDEMVESVACQRATKKLEREKKSHCGSPLRPFNSRISCLIVRQCSWITAPSPVALLVKTTYRVWNDFYAAFLFFLFITISPYFQTYDCRLRVSFHGV